MKFAGFFMLLAGWGLVLAAVVLLRGTGPGVAFVFAGIGVEALGVVLVARAHLAQLKKERG